MFKKILALAMVAAMGLSLVACGSSDAEEVTGDVAEEAVNDAAPGLGDKQKIIDKGELVVGITDFEPMDYKDENGEWVGFDADMARAFAESLGVKVKFVEIEWDNKVLELNTGNIDCVWNGMTITDEVTSSMDVSSPYLHNSQVVIVPKDKVGDYKTEDDVKDLNFAVEMGSAGEEMAKLHEFKYTPVTNQAAALMEVAAGTSDAAIIDLLMAGAMVGDGTSYDNLAYTFGLNDEEYGVGFRRGSDLKDELNTFFTNSYNDGSMLKTAEKYGVQSALYDTEETE